MAIVIESTSSTAFSGATSTITITKPTGLAVGELMVAVLGAVNGTSVASYTTLAGWTARSNFAGATSTNNVIACQTKIADSGDVAASNFTFTLNANARQSGIIFRISGHGPNAFAATTVNDLGGTDSTPEGTVSLTPLYNNSLIILGFIGGSQDLTGTVSGYAINGTNPTWTEYVDDTIDAGSNDGIFAVAAGIQATAASITTVSATATVSKNWKVQATMIVAQANSSGTADLLVTSPVIFSNASVNVGGTGTHALLSATPAVFDASGDTPTPTEWTDSEKGTATWTDQLKPE